MKILQMYVKKEIVFLFGIINLIYLYYGLVIGNAAVDAINILCFFLCSLILILGINDIANNGISIYSVFMVCYFGALLLNNLNISGLQKSKNIIDIYYYFFGALLFLCILILIDKNKKYKVNKYIKIDGNIIAILVLLAFVISKVLLFRITGIRFISAKWSVKNNENFIVQGHTGISQILMWLSIMMIPVAKRRVKIINIITVIVFSILSAARGDLMRIGIYLLLMWVISYGKKFISMRNVKNLIILMILLLAFFSVWGNYRQNQRYGKNVYNISTYTESIVNKNAIDWIYAYTALNFDILKQEYIEREHSGEFQALFIPIIRIIQGSKEVEAYYNQFTTRQINGFNAATFLEYFIFESGPLYFIPILFLGLLVSVLDMLCYTIDFDGGHIFLLMQTVLTIFGNYYLQVNMFLALILGLSINLFVVKNKKNKKGN